MAALKFSVNNRYIGPGSLASPTGAQMWFDFKEFMCRLPTDPDPLLQGPGWTVVMSAAGTALSLTGDCITSADAVNGGMGASNAWFVLEDPSGGQQFLFFKPHAPTSTNDLYKASEMLICYSAAEKFDNAGAHGGPISADRPPVAADSVWLHLGDTAVGTGPRSDGVPVDMANMGYITDSAPWWQGISTDDAWEMDVQADADAPYGIVLTTRSISNTMGFFCHDPVVDAHAADRCKYVQWFFTGPNSPSDGGGGLNLMNPDSNNNGVVASIRCWNKKPTAFKPSGGTVQDGRTAMAAAFAASTTRYLPISVPYLWMRSDQYGAPVIPRGLPPSIIDGQDELFPLTYVRHQPYLNGLQPNQIVHLQMPPAYKGTSSMLRLVATPRYNFDMFNVNNVERSHIVWGNPGIVASKWSGDTLVQG